MLTALTRVKPLSLAFPIVILAEHGELTLIVVTIENPRWLPDGEGLRSFPRRSRTTEEGVPPVGVHVGWSFYIFSMYPL